MENWKKGILLNEGMLSDWVLNLGECIMMAKFTAHIHNRSLTQFKQEWLPYKLYIFGKQGKYKYLEYGF